MRLRPLAFVLLVAASSLGCPAVFPEFGTRYKTAPKDAVLDPGPPPNLLWIKVVSATVPEKTRDGRNWDQVLGSLPDPYAKLLVNGAELFKTTVQSNTLAPTWPDGPHANYELPKVAHFRVELWDSSPINDAPIGVAEFNRPTDEALDNHQLRLELKGGGDIVIAFEPAHPMFGLGLFFELRNDAARVTRFVPGSPAERAGVQKDDDILSIGGKKVTSMSPDEVRSVLNSVPVEGVNLELKRADGSTVKVNLKEGPIYPTVEEVPKID